MPFLPSRRDALTIAAIAAAGTVLPSVRAGALDAARASVAAGAADPPPAVAVQWYDLTGQAVAAAAYPEPVTQSRAWAVSWLAAARAIGHRQIAGYPVAAFASALHDVLAALVPAWRPQLDAALAATLAGMPDGAGKKRGIAAGQREAAAVLAARAGDGLDTASVDVSWTPPPAGPGVWQPTPPAYGPAIRAGEGKARPFLLASGSQFRLGPPPALDSETYLSALAEVRAVGSAASTVRRPAQTDTALFWEPNSIDLFVQILRAVLAGGSGSLEQQARFIAAFHVITIDAQIAIYDTKYAYVFWRPVTAIRTGTVNPDPSWTPLFNTPRHPDYVSGHGGYAGAAEVVLRAFAGARPAAPISVTSAADPGSVHTYRSWPSITQENIDGRVWEGIHFRFSDILGVELGRKVAGYGLARLGTLGL
jgi:hypothetical protein